MSQALATRSSPASVRRRLHVVVVTVVHHPEDARIRHRQIAALLAAGHRVTYLAPFEAYDVAPPRGVVAVDVPRAQGRHRVTAARAVRAQLRRYAADADIVLLHDPELVPATAGLRGPRIVWDVHEDAAASMSLKPWLPRPLRPVAAWGVRAVEHVAERRVSLLLAEHAYAARFTREHPVVPNTAVVPEHVSAPGDRRVVYLGSITEARGAQELVDVARELRGEARVELVGPADAAVRPLVARAHRCGDIHWHGYVPNDRALELLDGALAGLSLLRDQPNYRHSQPTKVLEYMARGIPVLTTPLPLARAVVREHRAGLVVPFERPAAVADAVRLLQRDPDLRRALGANGHRAARAHYHWPRDAEAFVARLESWASCSPAR